MDGCGCGGCGLEPCLRQYGCDSAEKYQKDARVFEYRACRVCPSVVGGRNSGRYLRRALLYGGLCVHEPRRIRRNHNDEEGRSERGNDRGLCRACKDKQGVVPCHAYLYVFPCGPAADRRVCRKVLCVYGAHTQRHGGACHYCGLDERCGRVLLCKDSHADVHEGAG